VIHLPFPVTEKIIVDESFEVRDLVLAAKSNRQYLLASISKNGVRTLMGYGNTFVPVKYQDMPRNIADVTNSHSLPGWDYLDTEAYDEKNLHNYIRFVDDTLKKAVGNTGLPVILTGDVKLLGLLRKETSISDNLIGFVEGNYEHVSIAELFTKVEPLLLEVNRKEEERGLQLLAQSVSKDQYASGITDVWMLAKAGNIRCLLVEKDYVQPAVISDDPSVILIGEERALPYNRIADAVDDIIEMILKHKAEVLFVENGRLTDHQRIAAVARF